MNGSLIWLARISSGHCLRTKSDKTYRCVPPYDIGIRPQVRASFVGGRTRKPLRTFCRLKVFQPVHLICRLFIRMSPASITMLRSLRPSSNAMVQYVLLQRLNSLLRHFLSHTGRLNSYFRHRLQLIDLSDVRVRSAHRAKLAGAQGCPAAFYI